jgi:GH15 family glucan-1,4-alpha-glucosidase
MQKSYTATYGSRELDASSLLAAMSEVDDDRPERISATVDAIRNGLGAGDVLLYRRRQDMDGQSKQGAFVACTFWLIDAMARCGRIEEAERAMESAVKRGGELGLLGEETDPSSGEALGNYPQALSHSTLVSAALSIEAAKASRSHPGLRHTRRAREA